MKYFVLMATLFGWLAGAQAQSTNSFPLWPEGAPGALGKAEKDIPTLTPFVANPTNASGAALIICPGGGYQHLASHEGKDYALWLNELGITTFVLKYRLGSSGYHHPAMLQDAARALRLVRAHAAEWNLATNKIGIMGSSAGGHLASTLMTHFDEGNSQAEDSIERQSSRPDIGVLCYPVISMRQFAHQSSRNNLLGAAPTTELEQALSSELQVTKATPPCFIWSTFEDKTVPMENSLLFAAALRKAGVPLELHIYQKGPHGQGLGSHEWDPAKRLAWTHDLELWLRVQGFAKPAR